MTCIVAWKEKDGSIVMGGDSAGVSGLSLHVRQDEKVFINGPFIMGFTSSFRMGQLLRYKLKVPDRWPDQDVFEFMATTFIDAVRKCLKDGGYAEVKYEQESGGTFLVGYSGRLFTIGSDYQVSEQRTNYTACGCGDDIAVGAMHALNRDPEYIGHRRVQYALEAAEQFSAGVRGPFTIITQTS